MNRAEMPTRTVTVMQWEEATRGGHVVVRSYVTLTRTSFLEVRDRSLETSVVAEFYVVIFQVWFTENVQICTKTDTPYNAAYKSFVSK